MKNDKGFDLFEDQQSDAKRFLKFQIDHQKFQIQN